MIHAIALGVSLVLVVDAILRSRKKFDVGSPARVALGILLAACGYLTYGAVVVIGSLFVDLEKEDMLTLQVVVEQVAKPVGWITMVVTGVELAVVIAAGLAASDAAQHTGQWVLHLIHL